MLLRTVAAIFALASAGVLAAPRPASAQDITTVRIVAENVRVTARPSQNSEVMAAPPLGATLEVLDRQGEWYWVLLDRSAHGTRRAGWVRREVIEVAQLGRNGQTLVTPTPKEIAAAEAEREKLRRAEEKEQAQARKAEEQAKKEAERARKADEQRLKSAQRELEKARRDFEKLSQQPK